MKEDNKPKVTRKEFLTLAAGFIGGTTFGLAARPKLDYLNTTDSHGLRTQFPQEQLDIVGKSEKVETELGTFHYDLPSKLRKPDEIKDYILESKSSPSRIGVAWGEAAGLKTQTTSETSFYLFLMPKGKKEMEDIVPLRVPFPIDISDDELTKFTDGTYKFSLNLRKWLRTKGANIEIYEIIEKIDYQSNKYNRVSENWIPLTP